MTLEERDTLLKSPSFYSKIRITLCDWMNYWVVAGTDSIQDATVKMNTEAFIRMIIENIDECTGKVVTFVISSDYIKNAENEVSDLDIKNAIDMVITHCLPYLV